MQQMDLRLVAVLSMLGIGTAWAKDAPPAWLRKPTADELAAVFPAEAVSRGISGAATIDCTVSRMGILQDCRVVSEKPAGMGFGAAALQLAPQFQMRPATINDQSVDGGTVRIPLRFPLERSQEDHEMGGLRMTVDPPWIAAPTAAEVAAAYPKAAAGVQAGEAVMLCGFTPAGKLSRCRAMQEAPPGKGFGRAAEELSDRFQVALPTDGSAKLTQMNVNVPVRFTNPANGGGPRYVTKPHWIRKLAPDVLFKLFPAEAAKTGVKSGVGLVDCEVAADGALTACQAIDEKPQNLGFGRSAVEVASALAIAPWSIEGDPLAGAHMRLPIRFNLAPQGDTETAPPK